MVMNEFEADEIFGELNRKFANVSLEQASQNDVYHEITFSDLFTYRDTIECSNNYQACYSAIRNIRRYLTQSISNDRIQNVFDLGIQDKIRSILQEPGYDELKYETAWTITNLAYGTPEQTQNLVDTGIIDALIKCFRSCDKYSVKSQSAWALANVSVDSLHYRESMVQENLIGDIAQALGQKCDSICSKLTSSDQYRQSDKGSIIVDNKADRDDVKELTWSLANICRGGFKTAEHWEQYLQAFDAFSKSVSFESIDIWSEACWGLSRVLSNMYNYDPFFESLNLNPSLCPRLIHLLRHQEMSVLLPVLQTISNFTSGPNEYIEILLEADLLNNIWWYMTPDTQHQLRRNAILTISNLAAGNQQIVREVVYSEKIMQSVIAHVLVPGHIYRPDECSWVPSSRSVLPHGKEEWRIVKEVLFVLSNITTLANDDSICVLLRDYSSIIRLLSALLQYPQLSITVCLKVVDVLIRIVDRTNQISELTPPTLSESRNPYAEEMIREGVIPALVYLCQLNQSSELTEQSEILQMAITCHSPATNAIGSANAFGLSRHGIHLPGPNIRRIVKGYEDGDVRFIEDAINSIQL
ncbi:armadillo-type protein [Thamnidium elegans]|nr:armadillo-type protein [Thamnidium elegans]